MKNVEIEEFIKQQKKRFCNDYKLWCTRTGNQWKWDI